MPKFLFPENHQETPFSIFREETGPPLVSILKEKDQKLIPILFSERNQEINPRSILRNETGNPPGFYPQRERAGTNSDFVLRGETCY